MSHNNKLIKRAEIGTFIDLINNESDKNAVKNKILECLHKRMFNNITQKQISEVCNVSLRTIKRFEMLQVDKLSLFIDYKNHLENLPNKGVRKFNRKQVYLMNDVNL